MQYLFIKRSTQNDIRVRFRLSKDCVGHPNIKPETAEAAKFTEQVVFIVNRTYAL